MDSPADESYKPGKPFFFALATMGDAISYQTFSFLVFTFYYAVVGLNVVWIAVGSIAWSIWNSINDPLAGIISDRTNTRWGRRTPHIVATFVPLASMRSTSLLQ